MKIPALLIGGLALSGSVFAQFPLSLPVDSGTGLAFQGHPDQGYGIVGFSSATQGEPDYGHLVENVIKNAPIVDLPGVDIRAHYYIVGMQNSPFAAPASKIATAVATTPSNMANLSDFVANTVGVDYNDIRFNFGPKAGQGIENSWNLGGDLLDTDWTGTMASPVEQRIYGANPAEAGSSLYFLNTEIIVFGYSPLYEIINYGDTQANNDDAISAYSDPVTASIVDGLNGDALGLANAILADIAAGGGKVQLRFDTIQNVTYIVEPELGYIHGDYSFAGSIMVVPEPASTAAIFGGTALAAMMLVRRRRC